MVETPFRARALAALIPPPRLRLSDWIETNIRLPEGVSALPGAVRLWPLDAASAFRCSCSAPRGQAGWLDPSGRVARRQS
jgi:hypothetical protein